LADNPTNLEFAKIVAANYTVEEQPMWEMTSEALQEEENGDIIDILTVAYIPNLGRIDILIVPENFKYGDGFGVDDGSF
tara:strand:+ start:208 stop:444 length:237 start_codon:yes stop_codon:yes gene_type:complete